MFWSGLPQGGINISEKKQENREEISSHHEKKYILNSTKTLHWYSSFNNDSETYTPCISKNRKTTLKLRNFEDISDQKLGNMIWTKTVLDKEQGSLILFDQKQGNLQDISDQKQRKMIWSKDGETSFCLTKNRKTTKNMGTCKTYQTKNRETRFGPKQCCTKNREAWSCLTKSRENIKYRETRKTYHIKNRETWFGSKQCWTKKHGSLILLDQNLENFLSQYFIVFCSMCCNMGHVPLLFPVCNTIFSSSNEVENSVSRPLESKEKQNFKTFPKLCPEPHWDRGRLYHSPQTPQDFSLSLRFVWNAAKNREKINYHYLTSCGRNKENWPKYWPFFFSFLFLKELEKTKCTLLRNN